jgi:hypothetical protein
VLNALPRKLPTGTAWQSVNPIGGHGESALVSGLFGDDQPAGQESDGGDPSPDETALIPTARTPAQGRARVVQSTVVTDPADDDERPGGGYSARGQARVVVITDAKPAADDPGAGHPAGPGLPAPRHPEPDETSDE